MKIWDRIVEGATRLANGEPIGSLLGPVSPPADDGAHPGLRQIGSPSTVTFPLLGFS